MNVRDSATPPFFIVGSGRSGSTLLRIILAAHPSVCIPPETHFILPLVKSLPVGRPLTPVQIGDAVRIVTEHYRWPDLELPAEDLAREFGGRDDATVGELLASVYDRLAGREGATIWGDKTPPYIKIVPELASLFPGARFIYLIRDGHDVTRSFQTTGWYGPWLHDNTAEWRESVECRARWARLDAIPILDVRYEDLVTDLEGTTRRIAEFLEIDVKPEMLDWGEEVFEKIPGREQHIHGKLGRRPKPSDIYRYRNNMGFRECLIVESWIHRELRDNGYALRFASPAWRPVFAAVRGVQRVGFPMGSRVKRALRALAGR